MDTRFNAPILVLIKPPTGQAKVARIADVDAAFRALTREGLGGFGVDQPEWHQAVQALSRAKAEPSGETLEEARTAVRLVALKSYALLDG
jgi:hypothetical protein